MPQKPLFLWEQEGWRDPGGGARQLRTSRRTCWKQPLLFSLRVEEGKTAGLFREWDVEGKENNEEDKLLAPRSACPIAGMSAERPTGGEPSSMDRGWELRFFH